ncbi:hypothetical protein HUG15_16170 [Salicibibacter cibarius]|uniref:Uncharacterized protein n=1 Tax=Salicibibacter cibarius TaxID=2743000 RepID=A0A7T6Z531_9BACI|nr:hypothetical protein [Salicibibacter cibarius]QQK76956.1 hypothetical protein HUG15_16170 [Salicibibacter cibarius]
MKAKSVLVSKMMLGTFLQWTMWVVGIFLLIYIAIQIVSIIFGGMMETTILDAAMQPARVFLFVTGLLSMGGFLSEFVSNGVTRRDYYLGTTYSLFFLGFVMTLLAGVLYGLERLLFSLTGWNQWLSGAAVGDEAVLLTLVMVFFQFVLWYLLGWFISAGFYHHWLLGLGFIAASIIVITINDYVWGEAAGTLTFFHWLLPVEQFSVGTAVITSVILIILLVTLMRKLTKNAVVKV